MTLTSDAPTAAALLRPITLDPNEVRFYNNEGYLLLPGLVSESDAAALRAEVLDIYAEQGRPYERLCRSMGSVDKLSQTGEYLAGSKIDRLVNSPVLLKIASQLMGGPSTLYLPFTAVKNGGGGGRFHFHQDNQYTRFVDGLGGINIWFALSPMSPENGCLQIAPRTHRRGDMERVDVGDGHKTVKVEPTDFLPIRMRPGDAVAFSRLTLHGSGANNTAEPRLAYAVQFHRDDVYAVWDNQQPRPLKGANRWSTGPVARISKKEGASRDGH
jgi:2-oxoglutarate-dependent dioxygenase